MSESVALPTSDKKSVSEKPADIWVCPEFKVSGVFSSHMVLQRDREISVWGFSAAVGSKVTAEFMGETSVSTVNDDNKWVLKFSAKEYTKIPQIMKIYDDKGHETIFGDILIGDVWLIGGQSNAELPLAPCMCVTPDIVFNENDNFRVFMQTQNYVFNHQEYCNYPQRDIINPAWQWKRPDKKASLEFSALGWYFARELSKHIDIPLGMVSVSAGGACIRELVPEELAHSMGYNFGANVRESGYYNTLIHPFLKLPFKAMIFFQGESEGGDKTLAMRYDDELSQLVADERKSFGFDFPFYNVQLSEYREEGEQFFPWHYIVRTQQFDAAKLIPDYTLTVDMDLGAPADYEDWPHSPRKKPLAERVALLALAKEYGIGKEKDVSSPMPVSAKLSADGTQIIVKFKNVCNGLAVMGSTAAESIGATVNGFSFGDYDNRVSADAVITGKDTVLVNIPSGVECDSIGYAVQNRIVGDFANIRNSKGMPCPAFMVGVEGKL